MILYNLNDLKILIITQWHNDKDVNVNVDKIKNVLYQKIVINILDTNKYIRS